MATVRRPLVPGGPRHLSLRPKGWQLKFGTVAEAMPKGVSYGKFVHDNFDASTTWKDIEWVHSIFPGKNILKGILDAEDASVFVTSIAAINDREY
jgi:isopentenyl diphosphate isomerase/L-lactate dehydrogenase-like FMN-dependent dehydrogenase